MQPIYLTGHSRPVRKVMFNFDGDMLFTCSDDGKVCMYNSYDQSRVGVFNVNQAVKSIDVSKDTKYLLASSTTEGYQIFDCMTGQLISKIAIPRSSIQVKHVEFALGDQQFLVVYEHAKRSYIRIQDTASALKGQTNPDGVFEVEGPQDHLITQASWGPLNQTLYIATNKGKFYIHDLSSSKTIVEEDVHNSEIFSFNVTYDHTMLITCSKDGTAKLLHPRSLEVVRLFNFVKPCRAACISPLFDSQENQKFHVLLAGGQDARDVTTSKASEGGFEIKLMNIIYNQSLAEILGHFGTVHTLAISPDGINFVSGSEDGYVHFHKFLPEYFTKKFE
ncbi:eukaryotic translation initiation factor 3 subunit i-like [Stylonychia lemnae]|uniref:Serine-threonine kinase receptor-associated protein n=1 Tax=Stylonychia lemnae TaxID=5949 RepID=A0A078AIQ0_STYLE|nr:eukaryotic translation initiation factor 3 subunit i-like [Stylonychia lemnae]|eukprot:CDW80688.1 eukaryotic translation initiation factor 3 subunit i-like [Stylonychia lemnae]